MTQFLELNITEYCLDEDLMSILPENTPCVCCLSQEAPFVYLKTCKHAGFLKCYFEFKIEHPNNMVCLQCHNILKKIDLFRRQVEKCATVLNEEMIELKTSKLCNLQYSKIAHTTIAPEPANDLQITIDSNDGTLKRESESTSDYNFTTDIKIEHDYSDKEIDLPLSEIKKQILDAFPISDRRLRKKKGKQRPKKSQLHPQTAKNKYAGKIQSVTLSKEVLMMEREFMKTNEKYLKLPFKCELCIVGFDFEMALKGHMDKQHAKKVNGHTCDICKSVLSSEASFREHSRRHLKRYECMSCGKRYHDEYSAVHHYNEMHGHTDAILVEFQCTECDFTTHSHRSYRYHRSKHKRDKQACAMCGKLFVNRSSLNVHMYTMHKQSSRVYKCEPCGKVYKGKSGLFTHMRNTHGADRRAYCVACRTYYRTPRNLQHHLRTHSTHITDEDKFICNECGARFLAKASLKSHIEWEHLEMRNHCCIKCTKVFRSQASLKKHIEYVHEKKRPPRSKICDYCGRGFTTHAILKAHIRTHTGERPHRCAHCSATFGHSSALYNHNKLLHNPDRQHK